MSNLPPDALCICGDVLDEHDENTGTCQVDGCLCGGFEWDEENDESQ